MQRNGLSKTPKLIYMDKIIKLMFNNYQRRRNKTNFNRLNKTKNKMTKRSFNKVLNFNLTAQIHRIIEVDDY